MDRLSIEHEHARLAALAVAARERTAAAARYLASLKRCALCAALGPTVEVVWDGAPVRVCSTCFEHETGAQL